MTRTGKHFLAAVGLVGVIALGGCGYDDGYYGGVSVGSGYYGGGYYDDYWGRGYQPSYYGWYDGFYYPGSGYYVYDRGGRRHRWNDGHRRYWEGRRGDRDRDPAWSVNRGNWSRWRERSTNAVPSRPPVARESGVRERRPAWSAPRSNDGVRSSGGSRSGDGERRAWRR